MPAYTELYIDQGATFNSVITLTDELTNANLNLTSYSVQSKIRRSYYSVNAAASFVCTISDPANGQITMVLAAGNTALLKPGRYVYDVQLTDVANTISRVMEGTVFVYPRATK